MSAGRLQTLTVGALKKQNVEAMITQDLGMPGLLGQNFFGGYDVTIRESVIELRRR